MTNTAYDAAIIQTFANRLYRRAKLTTAMGTIIGALIGGFAFAATPESPMRMPIGAFAFFAFTAVGLAIGQALGFRMRLAAQLALCQVAIEQHTRA